ncbi:MAG: D-alanyl-D-alanine carboxypeptidase, partial [Actinomycetota bacterium]
MPTVVAMKKLWVCVIALSLVGLSSPAHAQVPPPALAMGSGILVEQGSGKILWSKDDEAIRAPASLTKILTALVVLENTNLDDPVVITPDARAVPGGRTYAEAGWTFTVRDMLWGLLLQSGNDAAISLAYVASP